MNAVEIHNLSKFFGQKKAVSGLDMVVPEGAIYGFIGENGSGKSTTEKIICGLMRPNNGQIKLFGKDLSDEDVRHKIGCLIETPGCFPNLSVWQNMMIQAANISLRNPKEKVAEALKLVRMEGSASNKFRNCSLGMKQRVGIAMALLGNPALLILDEPINGLDADGIRIMREVLTDLTLKKKCSVIISSHILGELEKIATHYGIIRRGKMIKQVTAEELERECPKYVAIKPLDLNSAENLLSEKYIKVTRKDNFLRIYGDASPEETVNYLFKHGIKVEEVTTEKISLEEYYIDLMKKGENEIW